MQVAASHRTTLHSTTPEYDVLRPAWMGLLAIGIIAVLLWLLPTPHALSIRTLAQFFSGIGNVAFLVIGYGALLAHGLSRHERVSIRVVLATLAIETLFVHVQKISLGLWLTRPSGSYGGFPSGHAAAACALAFLLAMYFPRCAILSYGIAIAISWSRIPMEAHWPYQVIVGAATGYLLTLLITDRLARRARHHAVIRAWQNLFVMVIPIIAVLYDHHEYENDTVILLGAAVLVLIGIVLRLRQYWRPAIQHEETHARRMQCLANTLICAGVTFGTELPWLVPLEILACITVYALVERTEPTDAVRESPSAPPLTWPRGFLRLPPAWLRECAWSLFILLPIIKESLFCR